MVNALHKVKEFLYTCLLGAFSVKHALRADIELGLELGAMVFLAF